eukprot:jgi/Hompol1/2660/HPOL_006102-RA
MIYRYNDYPLPFNIGFQDPGSDWMLAIIDLHDNIIFYLIILSFLVGWFLITSLLNKDHLAYLHHGDFIEVIWTITPAIILWIIGIPSLKLLYMMDEILDSEITIKITGYQWYWNYEYSDYSDHIAFDSFMKSENDLLDGELRQLTVDSNLVLPIGVNLRLLITANDVIHSFAVPSLAIKLDAIPGRLNSVGLIINRVSHYYGQCSELCGVMHSAMPICIQAVQIADYISFIEEN